MSRSYDNPSRFYNRSRPTLYRYAIERKYDQIPNHIRNSTEFRQEDIYWVDQYKCNVLHVLASTRYVSNELLHAVKSIVEVDTHLLDSYCCQTHNDAGYIPLHIAIQKRILNTRIEDARFLRSCYGIGGGGGSSTANVGDENHNNPIANIDSANNNNKTSIAIRNNAQLVYTLIEACPKSVSIPMMNMSQPPNGHSISSSSSSSSSSYSNSKYKTSLDICCEMNAHIDICQAILQINPKLVRVAVATGTANNNNNNDKNNNNQLQTLWSSGMKTMTNISRPSSSSSSYESPAMIMNDLETKMELILRALYCGSSIQQYCHVEEQEET